MERRRLAQQICNARMYPCINNVGMAIKWISLNKTHVSMWNFCASITLCLLILTYLFFAFHFPAHGTFVVIYPSALLNFSLICIRLRIVRITELNPVSHHVLEHQIYTSLSWIFQTKKRNKKSRERRRKIVIPSERERERESVNEGMTILRKWEKWK